MPPRPRDRWLRHPLEALGVALVLGAFRLLPPAAASDLGGALGRALGRRAGVTRRARRNLALALPELTGRERERAVRAMWDNLGRVAAEYPHLGRICAPAAGRVEVAGLEHLEPCRRGAPAVLAGGHLANWEVLAVTGDLLGLDLTGIVRAPNNPLVHRLLQRLRGAGGGLRAPKGTEGARAVLATLKRGGVVAMLVDQRMSDGAPVAFFGHEAMTATAAAELALRFACPLHPVRVERTGPARFRITVEAALEHPAGPRHAAAAALMAAMNRRLEAWIRERPGEWLWIHRRWPEAAYRGAAPAETEEAPS